jgi:hypothetical protein
MASESSDRSTRLNADLLDSGIFNLETLSPIPIMERRAFNTFESTVAMTGYYDTTGVQSRMSRPYLGLELMACSLFQMLLGSVVLNVGIAMPDTAYTIWEVFASIGINVACLGFVTNIFTHPDTYKSLNVTIEYLAINAVVYEYSVVDVLKYLCIQLIAGLGTAFAMVGIYYDLIQDIPTELILSKVMNLNSSMTFSYSYICLTGMLHLCTSVGLTILTDNTTSVNAKSRSIIKAGAIYLCRMIFSVIVVPVGYIFSNMFLYIAIAITSRRFDLITGQLLLTYMSTILVICFIYPLMAIQVKFAWINRYRRYLEYS